MTIYYNLVQSEHSKCYCGDWSGGILLDSDQQQVEGLVSLDSGHLACPVCSQQFADKQSLIEHAAEHARTGATQQRRKPLSSKPFKCGKCWKSFSLQVCCLVVFR